MAWKSCAMAVEYLEHSFTPLSSAWNFVNSTWPRSMLGRKTQAAPATKGAGQHMALLCPDVLTDTSPLWLQGSLPWRWSSAITYQGEQCLSSSSVNTYCFSGSSPERGAEVPQSLRKGSGRGEQLATLWHSLLPQLLHPTGWMKASIVFLCQTALALLRESPGSSHQEIVCKEMYKVTERGEWRKRVLCHPESSVLWSHRSLQKHSALQKPTLLPSREDSFACAIKNPWNTSASSMVKLVWKAV